MEEMRGNMKMGVSEGSARIEEAAAIDLQGTINDMKNSKYSDEEIRMALGITEEEMEEIFGDNEVVPETQVTMDVEDAPLSNTQVATTEDVLVDVPMSMVHNGSNFHEKYGFNCSRSPSERILKKKTSIKHGWGGEFYRSSFTFRLGGLGSKSNGKLLIEFPFCKQYFKGTESP